MYDTVLVTDGANSGCEINCHANLGIATCPSVGVVPGDSLLYFSRLLKVTFPSVPPVLYGVMGSMQFTLNGAL